MKIKNRGETKKTFSVFTVLLVHSFLCVSLGSQFNSVQILYPLGDSLKQAKLKI